MSQFSQVQTTTSTQEEAAQIAQALIEARLAACVQISGPIQSTYRWQGKIENSDEWCFVAKIRSEMFVQVAGAIQQLHSYDVPEITTTEIRETSPEYGDWLQLELDGD